MKMKMKMEISILKAWKMMIFQKMMMKWMNFRDFISSNKIESSKY